MLFRHPLGYAHGLGAGEPFLGVLGNFEEERFELGPLGLQDVWLPEPAEELSACHRHALARRSDELLLELLRQHDFYYVSRRVCAEQSLHVVGLQDPECLIQELHHLDAQHVDVAV